MTIFYSMIGVVNSNPYQAASLTNIYYDLLRRLADQQAIGVTHAVKNKGYFNRQVIRQLDSSGQLIETLSESEFRTIELPLFGSLEETENACQLLAENFKNFTYSNNLPYSQHIYGINFFPTVIDVADNEDLKTVEKFRYPNVSVREVFVRGEFSASDESVQIVEYLPEVEAKICLIPANKLQFKNAAIDRYPSAQLCSFKKDGIFYAWDVLNLGEIKYKEQQESYGALWRKNNDATKPDDEPLVDKVIRMFNDYFHPVTRSVAQNQSSLPPNQYAKFWKIAFDAQTKVEMLVKFHAKRSHKKLAESISKELTKQKASRHLSADDLINHIIEALHKAMQNEMSKEQDDFSKFKEHGSFLHRVNFIITQLTQGAITSYTRIGSNFSCRKAEQPIVQPVRFTMK